MRACEDGDSASVIYMSDVGHADPPYARSKT